jgi:tetratricopeptide (TPR) repeat protein
MKVALVANAISRWALLIMSLALPFFVIPAGWAQIDQDKMLLVTVFLSFALLVYVIGRLSLGQVPLPRHPLLIAAALLPLCYLVSALATNATINSYVSSFGGVDTVTATVLLFATCAVFSLLFTGEDTQYPLYAICIGIAVVILFQIGRLFIPSLLTLHGAMSGNASSVLGSWHDLGIIAALFVFISVVFLLSRKETHVGLRIFFAVAGAISFALLFIIGLADVWYALGGLFLAYSLYVLLSTRLRERETWSGSIVLALVPCVIGLAAVAAAYGSTIVYAHLPSSLQISQFEVRPSWQSTYSIGEKIFSGGQALFGSGPDTFVAAWGKWKPLAVNQTNFWSQDFQAGVGLIPTTFITAGFVGAIAWIVLLVTLLLRLGLFLRRAPLERPFFETALLGSILFLYWFHVSYAPGASVSILLFLFIGLLIGFDVEYRQGNYLSPVRLQSTIGVFAGLALFIFTLCVFFSSALTMRAVAAELFVSKAAQDYAAGQPLAHALALVEQALTIDPDSAIAHRAAVEVGLLQLRDLISKGADANTAELKTTLQKTIQQGLAAVSIDSSDYQNWLSLALLYQNLASTGVAGAYDNALSAYKKAAAANPTNPIPLVNAAQITMAQNDASSTLSFLNAALVLKPDLAVAYFLRSQVKGVLGDFQGAIQDAENAVSLARQDPLGWYNLGTVFYASGDYHDASLALSQAVSLQSNYANALFVLALSEQKEGNIPGALAAMKQVAQLNPGNAVVEQALQALQAPISTSTPKAAPTPRKK